MITSINHTICEKMREEERVFYLIQTKHAPCHTPLGIRIPARGTCASNGLKTTARIHLVFEAHRRGVTAKAASGDTYRGAVGHACFKLDRT